MAFNRPMYIYAMEYYSGINKNQLSIQTTTGMDFKGIMLNETKVSLNRSYTIQYHLGSTQNGKITELGNGLVVAIGLGMVGEYDYKLVPWKRYLWW